MNAKHQAASQGLKRYRKHCDRCQVETDHYVKGRCTVCTAQGCARAYRARVMAETGRLAGWPEVRGYVKPEHAEWLQRLVLLCRHESPPELLATIRTLAELMQA